MDLLAPVTQFPDVSVFYNRARAYMAACESEDSHFDEEKCRKDLGQIRFLVVPRPHVSIGEFMAIENTRMIPQQAASTVTNVDDIESYIRFYESNEKKYLWAIDLPVKDRQDVVRDLKYMGITAGSLFPGLDGSCEELAMRNFEL